MCVAAVFWRRFPPVRCFACRRPSVACRSAAFWLEKFRIFALKVPHFIEESAALSPGKFRVFLQGYPYFPAASFAVRTKKGYTSHVGAAFPLRLAAMVCVALWGYVNVFAPPFP